MWCYTGFTFEQLMKLSQSKPIILEFLKQIDVLIDGRFILSEKSLNVKFRGSKNQRIIDVKKSLKLGYAYQIDKFDQSFCVHDLFTNNKREVYI